MDATTFAWAIGFTFWGGVLVGLLIAAASHAMSQRERLLKMPRLLRLLRMLGMLDDLELEAPPRRPCPTCGLSEHCPERNQP